MSKIIALKSSTDKEFASDALLSDFSNLKQQALLFDQIGFLRLDRFYKSLEETLEIFKNNFSVLDNVLIDKLLDKGETIASELRWLQQEGLIFELNLIEELHKLPNIKEQLGQKSKDAQNLLKKAITIQDLDLKTIKDETQRADLLAEQQMSLLRFMAIAMESTKGVTAVTTFPYTEYTRELPNSNKSDVAQIIISKLPLPSNETPWEQIIDYRNDSDNQKNLLALRRWIRKISAEELTKAEVEEEIEWLINEFQEHMKYHKIKANTETLEVLVKAPLEIIEDLVKLKLSKIPEPFFVLKKRKLMLMEAEMNAPGKELAYLIKSKEAFESQK